MAALCLILLFLVLLVLGMPIGTALGVSALGVLIVSDPMAIQMTGLNWVAGIASFPLLAIPFFVLAGVILERAGLAAEIAGLFERWLGRKRGGMAAVAVCTAMFWGALSGSGPATTAAVGLILLAPMIRQGYGRNFAAATIANAADLSILIPPSIAFIIYGNLTGTSVSALFLAGLIPGMLTGLALLITALVISRKRNYCTHTPQEEVIPIKGDHGKAFWALLSPVIILGGIYAGIFTPTEAAVAAVFYSLFVATLIYRSLTWPMLLDILVETTITTSVIMFIVSFAGIFSWVAGATGFIDKAAELITVISPNAFIMILLVNILLLVLGMFLDAISISYLVMPMLLPVLKHFGIDAVWYGVVFIAAMAIGQATPPVGVNLFTAANLAKTDLDGVAKESIPFVLTAVAVLIVISLWPGLSLWLPSLCGRLPQ